MHMQACVHPCLCTPIHAHTQHKGTHTTQGHTHNTRAHTQHKGTHTTQGHTHNTRAHMHTHNARPHTHTHTHTHTCMHLRPNSYITHPTNKQTNKQTNTHK